MSYHSQFYNIRPGEDEAPMDRDDDVTASEQEEARRQVEKGTNRDKKDKNPNIPSGIGGSKSRKHLSRKRKGKKSYKKKKYGKSKKSRRFRRSVRIRR